MPPFRRRSGRVRGQLDLGRLRDGLSRPLLFLPCRLPQIPKPIGDFAQFPKEDMRSREGMWRREDVHANLIAKLDALFDGGTVCKGVKTPEGDELAGGGSGAFAARDLFEEGGGGGDLWVCVRVVAAGEDEAEAASWGVMVGRGGGTGDLEGGKEGGCVGTMGGGKGNVEHGGGCRGDRDGGGGGRGGRCGVEDGGAAEGEGELVELLASGGLGDDDVFDGVAAGGGGHGWRGRGGGIGCGRGRHGDVGRRRRGGKKMPAFGIASLILKPICDRLIPPGAIRQCVGWAERRTSEDSHSNFATQRLSGLARGMRGDGIDRLELDELVWGWTDAV